MYGEVYVPYTEIGGMNMDAGIMPMITGSTDPGVIDDDLSTSVNIRWSYPGGIINIKVNGTVGWGYAIQKGIGATDEDIKKWLMGDLISDRDNAIVPKYGSQNGFYSEAEILAEASGMETDINNLLKRYMQQLLKHDDYTAFRGYYRTCMDFPGGIDPDA